MLLVRYKHRSTMSTNKPFQPLPAPTPEETPQPAPFERPKRRFVQPTFQAPNSVRKIVTAVVLLGALTTQAQTTPNSTARPQSTHQTTSRGWRTFDDNMGREFSIPADQMQRLREIDTRYQPEYEALGKDPMSDPDFRSLNDRRNGEIRKVLKPETYDRWYLRYNPAPTKPGGRPAPDGTSEPKKVQP